MACSLGTADVAVKLPGISLPDKWRPRQSQAGRRRGKEKDGKER